MFTPTLSTPDYSAEGSKSAQIPGRLGQRRSQQLLLAFASFRNIPYFREISYVAISQPVQTEPQGSPAKPHGQLRGEAVKEAVKAEGTCRLLLSISVIPSPSVT